MGGFLLVPTILHGTIAFCDRIPSAFDRIVQLLAARGISSATRGWTKRVDALSKTILREKRKTELRGYFRHDRCPISVFIYNYYWWSRLKISLQLVLTYNCEAKKFSTREAIRLFSWKIRSVLFLLLFYWKKLEDFQISVFNVFSWSYWYTYTIYRE